MDPIKTTVGATRLNGFNKPTVWTVMAPLAIKTQSVNLVNAFITKGARISFMATTLIL